MLFSIFLWLLVWGGMFTGLYNLQSLSFLSSPLASFQGIRALFPVAAVYIMLLWILATKARFPFLRNPVRFLFAYGSFGTIISLLLSPNVRESLYWATLYLSPLLVLWVTLDRENSLDVLRKLIYVNYAVFLLIAVAIIPEGIRGGSLSISHDRMYHLPFNLGEMRSNGIGRFALIAVIIAAVRFLLVRDRKKVFWLVLLAPSLYLLARTQSRTALLGLAIVGILFVFMMKMDWRFIFVSPIAAYIVWISGVQWRAQGNLAQLVDFSGRQATWERGIALIKQSPFFGWGFHADRLLLNSEHMHNSFLHAMIHTGIIGTVCFILAFITVWHLIVKSNIFGRARFIQGPDQAILIESVLFLGFMTSRSFFESTGAFYGVDLLLIVPAMAFIHLWAVNNPQTRA